MNNTFLKRAIELASHNIDTGGGPFGALIVKGEEIIAEGTNKVTLLNDPTAHAEIIAIREAGRILNSYILSDCILYASCEPCPMCLGAIYWAHIPIVYFASDRNDAANAGFNDKYIYQELKEPIESRSLKMIKIQEQSAYQLFQKWIEKEDKEHY